MGNLQFRIRLRSFIERICVTNCNLVRFTKHSKYFVIATNKTLFTVFVTILLYNSWELFPRNVFYFDKKNLTVQKLVSLFYSSLRKQIVNLAVKVYLNNYYHAELIFLK